MMSIGWNFPENNYGGINGISEAGIETFKSNLYSSLAREICQNSLDARFSHDEPVSIDFQKIYINKNDFPDYDEFIKIWSHCINYWGERKNKKALDFLEKGKKVLESDSLCVLRISDYNTTGLTGSKDEEGINPWINLVKSSGVSDKGDSDGGSFGIGKSAPYACSNLRTLFYSTYDTDNISATQGVSKLVSFKNDNNNTTQGTGYYGVIPKNTAILEELKIDKNYSRNKKTGTDIFIMGFIDESN